MTALKLRPLTPKLTAEVANLASGRGHTISEHAIACMKPGAQGFVLVPECATPDQSLDLGSRDAFETLLGPAFGATYDEALSQVLIDWAAPRGESVFFGEFLHPLDRRR